MTSLLEDILDEDLTQVNARVYVEMVFDQNFADTRNDSTRAASERSKTPGNAKSLLEFFELVRQAVVDLQNRASVPTEHRVLFTEEEPDTKSVSESITFSTIKKVPGAFSGGTPFEGNTKNLKPMIRESTVDLENPGYRKAILGYWHDNLVRFTCWARTNKAANKRAEWFENLMNEYVWWFAMQGVARCIYMGQGTDIVTVADNNKWYGRPLDYFVRTEKISVFSEKTLEEILLRLSISQE